MTITRKDQKIFAGSIGVTGYISQFGSYKGGAVVYSDDPDTIQGYTGATGYTGLTGQNAWANGWIAAVDSNLSPTIQDMNAFFYVITRQLKYYMQTGIPEWIATITYWQGAFVTDTSGNIFISRQGNNTNNALSDTAWWQLLYSTKVTTVGDNYAVLYDDYIIKWSLGATSTGHESITFPTASTCPGREIIVLVSSSTGADPVKLVGPGETLAQYNAASVISLGNTWIMKYKYF